MLTCKFRDDLPMSEWLEFPVEWIVLCDFCGEPLTDDHPGNIELPDESKPILFLHKTCSDLYARKNGRPALWCDFVKLRLDTK